MSEFLRVCEQAARAAGEVLLDWRGKFEVREKGPDDLVTDADLAAQKRVSEVLLENFPGHAFLGEESAPNEKLPRSAAGAGYRWIVDPLDGTTNYVHGVPFFAVSVALERDGQLVCGTIYDPVAQECFSADAGSGAALNGRPIRTSSVERLADALVEVSFPPQCLRDGPEVRQFALAMEYAQGVRRSGSAALNLAYVAAGRVDAYWSFNTHAWDIAAGALLVAEAGGTVTGPGGAPLDVTSGHIVAAADEALHAEIVQMLRESGEI
jgi:myo-inositol-1(or 4)-monophosphatase